MTQHVTDFDGTEYEFPDDATEAEIQRAMGPPGGQVLPVPKDFGPVDSAARGATLTLSDRALAAGQATKGAIAELRHGESLGPALVHAFSGEATGPGSPSSYAAALAARDLDRAAYERQHPTMAAAAETAGATGTLAGTGNAVTGALRMAGKAIPGAARAGQWLTGGGGADAAGNALDGVGNAVSRVASQGASGAIQGASAGAAATPLTGGDVTTNALSGAEVGGAMGATLGTAANAIRGWYYGPALSARTAGLAADLRAQGIDLRAPQLQGQVRLTPGQSEQLSRAVARTFGEEGTLTPDVVSRADTRIQARLGAAANAVPGPLLGKAPGWSPFAHALDDGDLHLATTTGLAPADRAAAQRVLDVTRSDMAGGITGADYLRMTRDGSPIAKLAASRDPELARLGQGLREALDDALERGAGGPEAGAEIADARRQARNLALARGLSVDADGVADPRAVAALGAKAEPGGGLGPLATGARTFNGGRSPGLLTRGEFAKWLTEGGAAGAAMEGVNMLHGATHDPLSLLGLGATVGLPLAVGTGTRALRGTEGFARRLIGRTLAPQPASTPGLVRGMIPPAVLGVNALSGEAQ